MSSLFLQLPDEWSKAIERAWEKSGLQSRIEFIRQIIEQDERIHEAAEELGITLPDLRKQGTLGGKREPSYLPSEKKYIIKTMDLPKPKRAKKFDIQKPADWNDELGE